MNILCMGTVRKHRWLSLVALQILSTHCETVGPPSPELTRLGIPDVAAQGFEQYQDIIVNNQVIKRANFGHDHGQQRYDIIRPVLSQYQRPFTMLDLGCSQGYYSIRAANDYPRAVCVMMEGSNNSYPHAGTQLLPICQANSHLKNLIFLNKCHEISDLRRLGECEHFDVVLAMNVVHHFYPRWKEMAEVILNLGDNIIIETPSNETDNGKRDLEQFLKGRGAEILGTAPRHQGTANTAGILAKKGHTTFYWVKTNRRSLERKSWIMPKTKELKKQNQREHIVDSSFIHKRLVKKFTAPMDGKTEMVTEWVPGINLMTFKMYNGTYPTTDQLKTQLELLRDNGHADWMINNMIVQGQKVEMIDFNDPINQPGTRAGVRTYSPPLFEKICTLLDLKEPREVEDYFWYKIIGTRTMPAVQPGEAGANLMPGLSESIEG